MDLVDLSRVTGISDHKKGNTLSRWGNCGGNWSINANTERPSGSVGTQSKDLLTVRLLYAITPRVTKC